MGVIKKYECDVCGKTGDSPTYFQELFIERYQHIKPIVCDECWMSLPKRTFMSKLWDFLTGGNRPK